jgi:hypothetical protein
MFGYRIKLITVPCVTTRKGQSMSDVLNFDVFDPHVSGPELLSCVSLKPIAYAIIVRSYHQFLL